VHIIATDATVSGKPSTNRAPFVVLAYNDELRWSLLVRLGRTTI